MCYLLFENDYRRSTDWCFSPTLPKQEYICERYSRTTIYRAQQRETLIISSTWSSSFVRFYRFSFYVSVYILD